MATKHKSVRQRIQFAFNADADSVVGGVFQYLIKNHCFSSREGKRKGIDAMVAFYKPFAYQNRGEVDEGKLQAMAQDAVEILSRQIELLCGKFGVERPAAIAPDLKAEIKQAIAEVLIAETIRMYQEAPELQPMGTISESLLISELEAEEGVDFDDDTLLGDLHSSAEAAA
jgi:hypothetical protein